MQAVTMDEARQIFDEIYEEHPPEEKPRLQQWFELATGWLPLWYCLDDCIVPWEVVLEHGRRYVRYTQNHYDKAAISGYIDGQVKLVGGSYPW